VWWDFEMHVMSSISERQTRKVAILRMLPTRGSIACVAYEVVHFVHFFQIGLGR
jgi:hypothetical protein